MSRGKRIIFEWHSPFDTCIAVKHRVWFQVMTMSNYFRKLGAKGGRATAAKMTQAQRRAKMKKAARARWANSRAARSALPCANP